MNQSNQIAPSDELVFNIDEKQATVKEVPSFPKLNLLTEHNPLLRQVLPAYDFDTEAPQLRGEFVRAMLHLMRSVGGLGLSANQVGVPIRMFVMEQIDPVTHKRLDPLVCYNPEVIRELEPPKPMREACLSYPGLTLQVKRADAIEVSFQDYNGEFFELELTGLDAHCYQHELDHMNGVLFTSKVSRELMDWERSKQRKLLKRAKKMAKQYGQITA